MDQAQTVLIVEEHALIREYAALILAEDHGLPVVEASGLDEAIQVLRARSDIRVVLIEVEASRARDRYAAVRLLASCWPHLSIIVTTAGGLPWAEELPPGSRILPKPYAPRALAEAVRAGLCSRSQPIATTT